jgi:hypothetical protein
MSSVFEKTLSSVHVKTQRMRARCVCIPDDVIDLKKSAVEQKVLTEIFQ